MHAPNAVALMVNTSFAVTGEKAFVSIGGNGHDVKASPFAVVDGPPGSGKTTISNATKDAHENLGELLKMLYASATYEKRMVPLTAAAVRTQLRAKQQRRMTQEAIM